MIRVVSVAGVVTVQDGGRPGHMHEGVPPGGALVPELLARANAAVDNAPGEAGLEIVGTLTLAADAPVRVATDDAVARELLGGAPWIVTAGPRVRYVAVRGGIDVPPVLGGRGTLLVAGAGGLQGRPLRRNDVLPVGAAPVRHAVPPPAPDPEAPVEVVLGPDVDRFLPQAVDVLLASPFTVEPTSDRVGIRLSGPELPRVEGADTGVSAPMVRGALQVPPVGLIALGPDHPTTGGYPVLATVVRSSLGVLAARPAGATVRFVTRR